MVDKDQFTFDDDDFPGTDVKEKKNFSDPALDEEDDFPDTDLSAVFSDGEHTAEMPIADKPLPRIDSAGNPRTRILLMVLLLVLVGGAGAYYFMGLGGTSPSVPTAPDPAKTVAKSVALPQQTTATVSSNTEQTGKSVSVAVPPAPVAEQPASLPQVVVPAPQPAVIPVPVQQSDAEVALKPEPPAPLTPAEPVTQPTGGLYALDAGSYLLESNRDSLVAKAKKLGYEPLVTPLEATLDMTRLRLGTYGNDEVQAALDFARSIEPGSYSAPAGDGYVIYAGTFLKQENIDKLSQRFLREGIKVRPEPVQVVRTLSRIRFGSFATKEEAAAAAIEAGKVGLKAVVVKAK
jgi:cell division protein FtsN